MTSYQLDDDVRARGKRWFTVTVGMCWVGIPIGVIAAVVAYVAGGDRLGIDILLSARFWVRAIPMLLMGPACGYLVTRTLWNLDEESRGSH